jgi:hypothetical protein
LCCKVVLTFAQLIAKIQTGADAEIVSKFCADLQSLQIIDDYMRESTPPPSPCLEEEGFLVMGCAVTSHASAKSLS